jgi:Fur family transcriptional regulator, zinc uptake regulator
MSVRIRPPIERLRIEKRLDVAAEACARRGAKLTALRGAVLRLILEAEVPVTAYQLLDQLKEHHERAVPPTVYRALEFLLANDLIHKVASLSAFVACTNAGQHRHLVQFLICHHCRTVVEIEDQAVSTALQQAAARHGFEPAAVIVEVEGLCMTCRVSASGFGETLQRRGARPGAEPPKAAGDRAEQAEEEAHRPVSGVGQRNRRPDRYP